MRELAPGIVALRKTMVENPGMVKYAAILEGALVGMKQEGLPPEAMIALLASSLGYSIGHGLKNEGLSMRDARDSFDLAMEIMEDSAADALAWHTDMERRRNGQS